MKDLETQRQIGSLSNKEIAIELFEAVTDVEKRLFKTFRDLSLNPEKVFFDYTGPRNEGYFSVFRYLILSIFISYLGYSLFYQPGAIGGPFYTSIFNGVNSSINNSEAKEYVLFIKKENFDIFFAEFSRLMTLTYKLFSCFTIPSIFLSTLLFFRKFKFNFASLMVISVFMASQTAILSSILLAPLTFFITDSLTISLVIYIPIVMYFGFCFYRLGRSQYERPLFRSIFASIVACLIFSMFNMGFGSALSIYVHSYSPSYIEKAYSIPEP